MHKTYQRPYYWVYNNWPHARGYVSQTRYISIAYQTNVVASVRWRTVITDNSSTHIFIDETKISTEGD